jgi:hypothetical protein
MSDYQKTTKRPDPRRPGSWCHEGVAHDHQACGLGAMWDSSDPRDVEEAARWAEEQIRKREGMVLYHLLGQAIIDPAAVVGERQKHRPGLETVKAWQLRAVVQVLREQGIDPYAELAEIVPAVVQANRA